MTCLDDLVLGDYADDALTADRARAVGAHLSTCATCRALVSDLRAIRANARWLEPLAPPPHVWTRLSGRLDESPTRWSWESVFAWQNLATAAAAVIVATSLMWLGRELSTSSDLAIATLNSTDGASDRPASELELAEASFTDAIAGLEPIATEGRAGLDTTTAGALRTGLAVIDLAIGQSREALLATPEDELLQASLVEALRQKVVLLEDTVALIQTSPDDALVGEPASTPESRQ